MITVPHLETDITRACQLSCVACNHHVPLWRDRGVPPSTTVAQVEKDLFRLAPILHAHKWGALGGEPLLHAHLVDILKVVRDSGIADEIEVWSNGLLLQRQRPSFWRAFDTLVFSRYPGKHDESSVDWIRAKCADEGVALRIMDEGAHPNFKTLLEPTPTDPVRTRAKFAGCFFRHFSRVVNNGWFFTCCCAPHMPKLVLGIDTEGHDGICLDGLTEHDLQAYLTRTQPLDSCAHCAGRDTARPLTWSEEKDPTKWLKASAGL